MTVEDEAVLRSRLHALAGTVQIVAVKVAVVEEKQLGIKEQLDRIEHAVSPLSLDVAILKMREQDARSIGAKWGAAMGAFVAALIAGVQAIFGGHR